MLETLGVKHYLPLRAELRQWSDRKQIVEVPLFHGYLFVKIDMTRNSQLRVLEARGVIGLVGNQNGPLPIPDEQIDAIRTILEAGVDCMEYPSLFEGDRVRVVRGPLLGVEGTLLRNCSETRLVISVNMLQRSVAVRVLRQDVEAIITNAASFANKEVDVGCEYYSDQR